MKKIPYKLITLSTFLTITTANVIAPISTFASEVKQVEEGSQDTNLRPDETLMGQALAKARLFAESMNRYSYQLLKIPNVNFEGIKLEGNELLPDKIKEDQIVARENAKHWDGTLKSMLMDTLTNLTTYNLVFQNYYDGLVDAAEKGNRATLEADLTDLQEDILDKKGEAEALKTALVNFKEKISGDYREFEADQKTLENILKNKDHGLEIKLEKDKKTLQQIEEQVHWWTEFKELPEMLSWVDSEIGLCILIPKSQLKTLQPLLDALQREVDTTATQLRVVTVASSNVSEIKKSIDDAIQAISFMCDFWNGLNGQYKSVVQYLKKSAGKISDSDASSLLKQLKTSKDIWEKLDHQAEILQEGLKELKVEPARSSQ
ncbi:hypothetical protein BM86_34675 [Bacillus thuringiensis]|uniref:Hemolysin BL-binding component HblA n=1 Tax=Bacillus thuringiensis TaxID=1428 RepID=A0A9W3X484_BACTU|nr:HBL/NHE enterotoxin family protein [Bacillus thuringiensis]ANS51828.1 hemolysin BL-binding component HblA [Bacillus thuringiensis]MBH0340439.1 hypothetical protein [Bacillus thuringiensis]